MITRKIGHSHPLDIITKLSKTERGKMRKNNITLSLENIISFFRNITSNFTGKTKIIILVLAIIMLSFVNIRNTSALSYQGSAEIKFTFNPTLSINISPSDLVIQNLTPGTMDTSNEIAVTVSTNNVYGYNLYATVGNSIQNNTNLTRYGGDDIFNSISASAGLPSLDTDNTWGYAYSLDSGNTWSNYNGLPLYSAAGARLKRTNEPSEDTVNFKIAAKSSTTQPSGSYSNVINFIAVTKLAPLSLAESYEAYYTKTGKTKLDGYYVMQDMNEEICDNAEIMESELQVIDSRDRKVYWIAKLKDENCWMTQNLDLDLSHEVALTSEASDIDPNAYGTSIYTQETGYSRDSVTGIVSWLPSTIDSDGMQRADTIEMIWDGDTATIPGWKGDYKKPYSADPGNRYRYTNSSYVENGYSSLGDCATNNNGNINGCKHGHYGNYYNWNAAVASNNKGSFESGVFENSVCPKNWKLPDNNAYGVMLQVQDVWSGSGESYTDNGFNNFRTAPLYFARFGLLGSSDSFTNDGYFGNYWTSALKAVNFAYRLYTAGSNRVLPSSNINVSFGLPVRCLAR